MTATYVVGDLQGCLDPLLRLLDRVGFGPRDRLWLVGDLVNRGPDSLGVLRWAREQDPERLVAVLGNHDLNLLAVAAGQRRLKRGDTLTQVLEAPDRDACLDWLRERPLMHQEDGWLLVHAGLLPAWNVAQAQDHARRLEAWLRGSDRDRLLAGKGDRELQAALQALVRLRFCTRKGRPDYGPKGPPGSAGKLIPWFAAPDRCWAGQARVICGHWAALGLVIQPDVVALDTGCVWGRDLTCMRLEDGQVFQVPATPRSRGGDRDTLGA